MEVRGFFQLLLCLHLLIAVTNCTNRKHAVAPVVSEAQAVGDPLPEELQYVLNFCQKLNTRFKQLAWNGVLCEPQHWRVGGKSVQGQPLLYGVFGDQTKNLMQTTLVLCAVHGDEATSVYLCFAMVQSEIIRNEVNLKGRRVVIAPVVNPDGFLAKLPSRTNANGVDLNRNFETKDWQKLAYMEWTKKYNRDKRKYPGSLPNSEPETKFQVWLLDNFHPDKILSAHAPLKFIDYDGPADQKHSDLMRRENRARFLAMNISRNSRFPLVDYKFFPGSLGNFAGQHRGIPTYTLELASGAPEDGEKIWKRFEYALQKAIRFDVTDEDISVSSETED